MRWRVIDSFHDTNEEDEKVARSISLATILLEVQLCIYIACFSIIVDIGAMVQW